MYSKTFKIWLYTLSKNGIKKVIKLSGKIIKEIIGNKLLVEPIEEIEIK